MIVSAGVVSCSRAGQCAWRAVCWWSWHTPG